MNPTTTKQCIPVITFTHILTGNKELGLKIEKAFKQPKDYDSVCQISHDEVYGDVFEATNNNSNHVYLYFGTIK